jgi:hypothetical protein
LAGYLSVGLLRLRSEWNCQDLVKDICGEEEEAVMGLLLLVLVVTVLCPNFLV